jgi:hypothetical protein
LFKDLSKNIEVAREEKVKSLETSWYGATRNDGDDNEAEIRLKDRIEGNGFMNVFNIANSAYNTAIDLVAEELNPSLLSKKVDTDPLADEKKEVAKTAFKNKEKLTSVEVDNRKGAI